MVSVTRHEYDSSLENFGTSNASNIKRNVIVLLEVTIMSESNNHLLNESTSFPEITLCLFDLEGTLFWTKRFKELTFNLAVTCVSDLFNISAAEARKRILDLRNSLAQRYGYLPALSTTLLELGVSFRDWATHQRRASLDDIPTSSPEVIMLLRNLSKYYRMVLYSNMCMSLAIQILKHLGLENIFSKVITPEHNGATKPSVRTVKELLETFATEPSQTLSIGDRYEIDIVPVIELGGYGYLVSSMAELTCLCRTLLSRKGLA